MTDLESVDSSMRRVRDTLRVLVDDQGSLVVASTLDATADALTRIRYRLTHGGAGEPDEVLAIVEFIDELTSMLLPLVARRRVAR